MFPVSDESGVSGTRRPRVAMVMHSVYNAKFFLVPHLRMLGEEYEVLLYLRNDAPEILATLDIPARIIEIPIQRKIAPLSDLRALVALICAFLRDRPDLVHSMTPKGGLLGMLASFIARVPCRVHTFQGEVWLHFTGFKRLFFRFLDWLVVKMATDITVVSASERDFLRQEGVLAAAQGEVLGSGSICGVDLRRFHPRSEMRAEMRESLGISGEDFVVLYLGRLRRDKGLNVLRDAFALLGGHAKRSLKLLVVGPDEDGLSEDLRQALGNQVILHPYTERPEDFIAAADILALPSFREGFGMVLIEAAAMGAPSVASRIYGISCAVVDDETGLLFEMGNPEDMAAKMKRLIDDPELLATLSAKGIERTVREFDQNVVVAHFRDYYRARLDPTSFRKE
jgi:glycosyltransferase involved in cell wall biosynthesis